MNNLNNKAIDELNSYLYMRSSIKLLMESEKNHDTFVKHCNSMPSGDGKFMFEIGQTVYGTFPYTIPYECTITDRYIENGWDRYTVIDKHKFTASLRREDILLTLSEKQKKEIKEHQDNLEAKAKAKAEAKAKKAKAKKI